MDKPIKKFNSVSNPWVSILIDEEDWDRVKKYDWYINKNKIISTSPGRGKSIALHRFILGVTDAKTQVDHINHDRLDNRKENLRICNSSQNMGNNKPQKGRTYKGAYLLNNKYWIAQITFNYKIIYLGIFNTEIEAAKAYDIAAKEYFGEFARLNFPNG